MSNYQELTNKLQTIMTELQSGEIDLDKSLKKYEEGIKIIKELETQLKSAENKVKKIQTN